MTKCISVSFGLAAWLASVSAFAQYEPVETFPAPAEGAFSVVGTNTDDGRLLLWDGQNVIRQINTGGGLFETLATGYDGSGGPGFIAVSPDGTTAALGVGFGDGVTANIYLIDPRDPDDFGSGTTISGPSHFSGVFLTNTLLLLDTSGSQLGESQLEIVDIAAKSAAPVSVPVVMRSSDSGAKDLVVEKPGGASAVLGISPDGSTVYVTEPHGFDAEDTEIRSFAAADLINAFNTSTPLDFETDGALIGTPGVYNGGGVSGVRPSGNFVIAGSGGVQVYNPNTDTVETTLDPANGGPFAFYSVIYNNATDEIIPIHSGVAYATASGIGGLPASSAPFLVLAALGTVGTFIAAQRRNWKD